MRLAMERPEFFKTVVELPGMTYRHFMSVDTVTLPDKTTGRWEAFYVPPGHLTVSVAAFTPKGKMILVEMFRFPTETWCLELPGGDVKGDEEPQDAARRELLEETGYATKEGFLQITGGFVNPANMNAAHQIFYAPKCVKTADPALDPMELAAGLKILERNMPEIIADISSGTTKCHSAVSHALISLLGRKIISV